ncbi:MAG: CaiB/BaiF CoA-transferase family protein [Acidimicrobiales bacterium]|nr:CaiB/BaiF CoA-transferase family protein [Acidimicrobiales bacterium]
MTTAGPLSGIRVIESSMLGPGAITTHLADLGADVIKVESPQGDYVRQMSWPIIDGESLLHWHISRGKRSIVLNLKSDEGVELYKELVADAHVVVEAMRPGALQRLGLGYEVLREINPAIVFCTISGYGATGPFKSLPSHGIAYDTWAGVVTPEYDEAGFPYIPEHVSIGINAAPVYGAMGILAGVVQALQTGTGCQLEIAQSDAAASIDWLRSETYKAYERPESEVTGNKSDDYERRLPGTAGMKGGVRYSIYESSDGYLIFMSSEREFWKNFCEAVGRPELFEKWPGNQYADHARGNRELQAILADIFKTRTTLDWVRFGDEHNVPIAPVNSPKSLADDPQFQDRLGFLPASEHGADMLPTPIKVVGDDLAPPRKAPTVGQHSDEVLREVLGKTDDEIAALREQGTTA